MAIKMTQCRGGFDFVAQSEASAGVAGCGGVELARSETAGLPTVSLWRTRPHALDRS
jgi:hypothetical protein